MNANKLIYPYLSYTVTGSLFNVHNRVGRYSREKQYGDELEREFQMNDISYIREHTIDNSGNICDFVIDDKIIIELKAKDVVTRDDYYQIQRYLQAFDKELGILVNFRQRYLKPARILKVQKRGL